MFRFIMMIELLHFKDLDIKDAWENIFIEVTHPT